MPTPKQLTAIAAALSTYLESEVQVVVEKPVNPWGWAARRELTGHAVSIESREALGPVDGASR